MSCPCACASLAVNREMRSGGGQHRGLEALSSMRLLCFGQGVATLAPCCGARGNTRSALLARFFRRKWRSCEGQIKGHPFLSPRCRAIARNILVITSWTVRRDFIGISLRPNRSLALALTLDARLRCRGRRKRVEAVTNDGQKVFGSGRSTRHPTRTCTWWG